MSQQSFEESPPTERMSQQRVISNADERHFVRNGIDSHQDRQVHTNSAESDRSLHLDTSKPMDYDTIEQGKLVIIFVVSK